MERNTTYRYQKFIDETLSAFFKKMVIKITGFPKIQNATARFSTNDSILRHKTKEWDYHYNFFNGKVGND